jgi:hypothetical protein
VLAQCRQLLHAAFQRFHGHEVDTHRDAFCFAFARATDAVSAAVAAQRILALHTWPEGATVRVRMGLHTGEPQRTIDWSYQLLDANEQRLFRWLSVFVGGCTLQAIEVLCATLDTQTPAIAVLDTALDLVHQSTDVG